MSGVPAESRSAKRPVFTPTPNVLQSIGAWASAKVHTAQTTPCRSSIWPSCVAMSAKREPASIPLRGQNNVQGCSDSGGLPNVYTAYQKVDDPDTQKKFQDDWGVKLNTMPGLTATEMVDGAALGTDQGDVHFRRKPDAQRTEPRTHPPRIRDSSNSWSAKISSSMKPV